MRSDERVIAALDALRAPWDVYHSAVAMALEQVRAILDAQAVPAEGRGGRTQLELGVFAAGRIDAGRFASLLTQEALDPVALGRIEGAYEILRGIGGPEDGLRHVEVSKGSDLRAHIHEALSTAGLVFGAARAAEAARTGRYRPDEHDRFVDGFPFRKWNRAERGIAPPLVVEVDGGDLIVCGLAELLDGQQKIALVVQGAAPPAALAELITPGVFVAQSDDEAVLARLAAVDGPGIAALVASPDAVWVHDPSAGSTLAERLTVEKLPEAAPRGAIGQCSVFRMAEQLAWLHQLAALASGAGSTEAGAGAATARPVAGAVAGSVVAAGSDAGAPVPAAPAPGAADPAGKLAAWLLQAADLKDAG